MPELRQTIRYCKAADGLSIAWSTAGSGPPIVWCSMYGHLEETLRYRWGRAVVERLACDHTLIRYDGRGSGLSDRGFADVTIESAVADMESVVEAARLAEFTVMADLAGAQAAIVYCARHPERVRGLCLYGGVARGLNHRSPSAAQLAQREVVLAAMETGWSDGNPALRTLLIAESLRDATREELESAAEAQRAMGDGRFIANVIRAQASADVSEDARRVRCPVLVLHPRENPRVPFEEGSRLASLFSDGRIVPVDSRNAFLVSSDPAFEGVMREVLEFHASVWPHAKTSMTSFSGLTPRERDVLELLAQGLDNLQIAAHLGVSEKTVRNHITPIFDKLAVENRGQAIVKAREAGMGIGKRRA